jgi:hypothetical protein
MKNCEFWLRPLLWQTGDDFLRYLFGRRVIKNARNILLGRPMLRYLFERAMRDGPQSAQGAVSPLRTKLQFLCDVATAFVVAAVREDAAGLF